jgi:hypothetical protein
MKKYDFISITKANDNKHKYIVILFNRETGRTKQVKFGAFGMTDFTLGATLEQRNAYLLRHRKNENWSADGVATSGFWAAHLLWGESRDLQTQLNMILKHFF